MAASRRRPSTNPFDSSPEPSTTGVATSSSSEDVFHDALEEHSWRNSPERSPPVAYIDTRCHTVASVVASQAAHTEYESPFERALSQLMSMGEVATKFSAVETLHVSNSRSYGAVGGNRFEPSRRKSSRRRGSGATTNRVLRSLDGSLDHGEDHRGNAPWAKLILLEEMGTASSWAILLVPYIAFAFCLFLDTSPFFVGEYVVPLKASTRCFERQNETQITPLLQTAPEPCTFQFALHDGYGILSKQLPSFFQSTQYLSTMSEGTAFSTGPIPDVPPMSVFIRGDATYHSLSTEMVAMVARGDVVTSTVVMQRITHGSADEWTPLSISKPEELTMVCEPADADTSNVTSLWRCTTPRIVDVLFAMPGTAVLGGSEVQVNVLYAARENSGEHMEEGGSFVFSDTLDLQSVIDQANISNTKKLVKELVLLSSYTVQHESRVYTNMLFIIRLITMVLTLLFILGWCWCFGVGLSGLLGWCCDGWGGETRRRQTFWWESPWILFPERIYLLLLLFTLVMLQNPLLVYAHFNPALYGSATFHTAVDALIGIGSNLYMMLWLCLFQGLRYHTADIARRRAKQQRQVLELRRTARYIAVHHQSYRGTDDFVENYVTDYHEQFGDVDGTGMSGALDIRVKHDPFGEHWPDFLLPKLFLLVVGIVTVLYASAYRFPKTDNVIASVETLEHYNAIYIACSFLQIFILFLWVMLILHNAFRTGRKLRKEPFLSTRPVQLAYRILLGILFLAVAAVAVPFIVDLLNFVTKWSVSSSLNLGTHQPSAPGSGSSTTIDVLLRVLVHVSQRFPYFGTAAGIGPGKILFSMVCAIMAAVIFLPSRSFMQAHVQDRYRMDGIEDVWLTERGKRRRDKRVVVNMARYTHTWRVFPLPIKRVSVATSLLSDVSFKIGASDHSVAFFSKYTPVFCVETACWLLEASWQAYYSPRTFVTDSFTPVRMTLESIGLQLERAIFDESTQTQAFVATNTSSQVDGEEDSIIVVSFRGTANARNMSIDLKLRQVPLLDQLIGAGDSPMFEVSPDGVEALGDEWFWDTPYARPDQVKSFSPRKDNQGCLAFRWIRAEPQQPTASDYLSFGVRDVLRSTPMARQAFPCVHQGFQEAYSHIRRQLFEVVLETFRRQLAKAVDRCHGDTENPSVGASLSLPKIYITGHSLGGSLGQLLALDLANNCDLVVEFDAEPREDDAFRMSMTESPTTLETPRCTPARANGLEQQRPMSPQPTSTRRRSLRLKPPIAVYTFGQPRVGNHAFARFYKQRVPHTFRVVNEGDAFTSMPTTLLCGGMYKHAGLEVMLDEGMTGNILVGPTVVETMFRFTKVRTSVAAHSMAKYRDCLQHGLTEDELQEYYRTRGTTKAASDGRDHANAPRVPPTPLPDWLTQVKRRRHQDD